MPSWIDRNLSIDLERILSIGAASLTSFDVQQDEIPQHGPRRIVAVVTWFIVHLRMRR
jgi:hypothetical protein